MSQTLVSTLFGRGDEALILGESGKISASTLLQQAGVIAAQLPDATPGSEVAFSFERDRAACLAALLATWSKGHTAALPEDGSKESIVPLLGRKENVAFLHDTGVGLGTHVPTLLKKASLGEAPAWTSVSENHVQLAAFLQPALGEPTIARWTQAELLRDLNALAEKMSFPAGAHVANSMTPTAMPGLLLGMLVPALRGATFEAETPSTAGQLAQQIRERKAHSLIATPAHARGLARLAQSGLAALYCVDEGLDSRTAAKLRDEYGIALPETPKLPLDVQPSKLAATLTKAFLSCEAVDDAAVATLRDESGQETQVFATIVGAESKLEACHAIANEHLPAGLPCEIAPRPSLPRDANGRLPKWQTLLNFGYGRAETPLEPSLSWSELASDDPQIRRFQTRLPENYAFFEGHYISYAVLPGAVQIHELALPCIRRFEPAARVMTRLTGLKFMSRIAPGDEIVVSVTRGSKPGEFRFEIVAGEARCSAGTLLFALTEKESAQ